MMTEHELKTAPLGPGDYQSIEIEQFDIHKRYLLSLRGLQVLAIPGEKPRPKQPAQLYEMIGAYAHALFDAEARRYPENPQRCNWWKALVPRIVAMMADRIWEMDTRSVPKLTYHSSREEIDDMMISALNRRVAELIGPQIVPAPVQQAPPEAESVTLTSRPQTGPNYSRVPGSMAQQIRTLRYESRLTIEELAAEVGIAARTVQRHESGEVQDIRLRHIRDYERVFSSLLKYPVRLEKMLATSLR